VPVGRHSPPELVDRPTPKGRVLFQDKLPKAAAWSAGMPAEAKMPSRCWSERARPTAISGHAEWDEDLTSAGNNAAEVPSA
jgi:hypothetical protein